MDTKGSPKFPVSTLASTPIQERIVYVAIKGSLHASDCSVFGLDEQDIKEITKKYEPVINGFSVRENVLQVLNSCTKSGFRVISSTGESEITWTMQKEF